ncbi:MAG TPA: diacylglycerol kinase [Pirellulales bacterium]|jgi:diacylglycerol kinase
MAKREPAAGSWIRKFRCAFRGVKLGVRGESSFFVHFFMAAAVLAAALALQATLVEWCLLLLCVAAVLTAEMINSALERLALAIDQRPNPHIRDALDIGSGAVLVASIGAAIVGIVIFLNRLVITMNW